MKSKSLLIIDLIIDYGAIFRRFTEFHKHKLYFEALHVSGQLTFFSLYLSFGKLIQNHFPSMNIY